MNCYIYRDDDDDDDDDDVWCMMYDRVDLYYNLMRRSIFMTIHMNALCDDGHITTHIIENVIVVICIILLS